MRVKVGGLSHQLVGPAAGEEIGLLDEIVELVGGPLGVGEALVAWCGGGDRRAFFARESLDGRRPEIEISFAEPGLQFEGSLRVRKPVFGDVAERLDNLGYFLGELAVVAAFFTGFQVRRKRSSTLLDNAGQIARKHLDINRADLHRLLRWSLHERSSTAGGMIAPPRHFPQTWPPRISRAR